jgi:7-cyano-7-deazaguanine synthase in queuosine biosynthesis
VRPRRGRLNRPAGGKRIKDGDHRRLPHKETIATMQRFALDGFAQIALATPFLRWSKADIVREAARLGAPFAET